MSRRNAVPTRRRSFQRGNKRRRCVAQEFRHPIGAGTPSASVSEESRASCAAETGHAGHAVEAVLSGQKQRPETL
jgi:hypothetical protein